MRPLPRFTSVLALAACLASCGPASSGPPAPEPAARSAAAAPDDGVEIAVELDRTEMRTVDRLTLTITTRRPAGLSTTLMEPDWAASDWTRVDATDSEPRALPDGRIERARAVTLEPFLDGTYPVNPVVLAWTADGQERVVGTQPLTVTVASVLPADDAGDLAAPAPPVPAPAPTDRPGVGLGGAIAALLLAGTLAWWLLRPRRLDPEAPPDPVESLRGIAAGTQKPETAYAVLHRALVQLAPTRAHLAVLVARCERARFDPSAPVDDPGEIARDALRCLEGAP